MLDRVVHGTLIAATAGSGLALVVTPFYCLGTGANLWAGFLVFFMSFVILVSCFGGYFMLREYPKSNRSNS